MDIRRNIRNYLDFLQEPSISKDVPSNIKIKRAQYNSLNVKLTNSQLNELKTSTKNEAETTLKLSPFQ